MNQRNIFLSCFLIALMGVVFSGFAPVNSMAAVRARLDRQTISSDETVTLSIEADGALNSISSLDTSALEKDFSIINQSTSSNFQIINGSSKATKTWILELEPKHTGTLVIPSFSIHGEKSQPLTLTVTEPAPQAPGTAPGTGGGDAFLEVVPELDTLAYPQEQITVSIKLFIKSHLNVSEASLEEPKPEHAAVIKLGDDRRYQSRRHGVVYQVIERKYAIIPEEGKEVTIPPVLFQARVSTGGNRFFSSDPFFDRFSTRSRRLRVRSQELTIPLTPIPDAFQGKVWLPARSIKIREDKAPVKEIKVGEPLTRTIQLEALGLTAEQLPELKIKAPEGCKIYLDRPELKTQVDSRDYLRATKRQSIAFIPSRAGTFTLPEIRIDWWDVVNNCQKEAVLPAHTITVVAMPGQHNSNPSAVQTNAQAPAKNKAEAVKKGLPGKVPITGSIRFWQLTSFVLLLFWLATLWFWYHTRRRQAAADQRKREVQKENRPPVDRESIKKACSSHDPRQVQQAILNWAAAAWPQEPPTNLKNLAAKTGNAELMQAFDDLEAALYSPEADRQWDGNQFWQTIAPYLRHKAMNKPTAKRAAGLPPLYPRPG